MQLPSPTVPWLDEHASSPKHEPSPIVPTDAYEQTPIAEPAPFAQLPDPMDTDDSLQAFGPTHEFDPAVPLNLMHAFDPRHDPDGTSL